MAKGKSSSGKQYVSKGERRSSMRTRQSDPGTRLINQQKAWSEGKNVMLTIPNPNPNETNKRYIRVNASSVWGSHKNNFSPMT